MKKRILHIDLDGVVANFDKKMKELAPELDITEHSPDYEGRSKKVDEVVTLNPNFFENLEPIQDAIQSVMSLSDIYDIYFLSTPMWAVPESWSGKRIWLEKHFGDFAKKKLNLS